MKTCITTGLQADGTHVCLYVGPDAEKAIACCIEPDPKLGLVATAAFVNCEPRKKRKFDLDPAAAKKSKPKKPKPTSQP